MDKQYGATEDANAPVPKVEEPQNANRARKAIAAIALTSTMMWAATSTTTGRREVTRLTRMVTGNQPVTIAEVYDILVTQSQDLTVYCNAAAPGTQPYALCGLTTCAGVEEYDYLGACKCAQETIDEMYAEDPITATFVMGYTSVFLAKSETFREAVMANYLGQLDDAGVQNLCTALTDGQICKESGLDCDFVSFHTGAQNGVCGDDNWVATEDKKEGGRARRPPQARRVGLERGRGLHGRALLQARGRGRRLLLADVLVPHQCPGRGSHLHRRHGGGQRGERRSASRNKASTARDPTLDEVEELIDGPAEAGQGRDPKGEQCATARCREATCRVGACKFWNITLRVMARGCRRSRESGTRQDLVFSGVSQAEARFPLSSRRGPCARLHPPQPGLE